jgi:hypothetical protein
MEPKFKYRDGEKEDCFYIHEDTPYTLTSGKVIIIPDGLETDFASIPRGLGLWELFPPHKLSYRKASIVHDYLYMDQKIITSRAFADMEFKRILLRSKVHPVIAFIFWACVRLGGSGRWNKYKKLKEKIHEKAN